MADLPPEALAYKPESREKIRRAIARVVEGAVREAGTKLISVERVKGAGASDQNATTKILKLWREGALSISDSWGDDRPGVAGVAVPVEAGAARAVLAQRIREASTDGQREACMHELAALVTEGAVSHEEAREIRGPLTEARLSGVVKRTNEPPPEDPTKLLLASPEAMEAARAIDLIEDDERRDRLLAHVAEQLETDMAMNQNTDQGGAR